MAGKTPAEAVNNFLEPLQRSLSCVSSAVFTVSGGYYATDFPHQLTIDEGFVSLAGTGRLMLSIVQNYRVVEDDTARSPWKVTTTAYEYAIADHSKQEILAFHWHPGVRKTVPYPHLHLRYGAKIGRGELLNAHVPTGRIALEDVLRFLIREMNVKSTMPEEDAIKTLDESYALYQQWKTW